MNSPKTLKQNMLVSGSILYCSYENCGLGVVKGRVVRAGMRDGNGVYGDGVVNCKPVVYISCMFEFSSEQRTFLRACDVSNP